MENALGEAQTIVLLGGTSDIGRAIVDRAPSPVDAHRRARRPPTRTMRPRATRAPGPERRRRAVRRRRPATTSRSCATSSPATATSTSVIVAFGQLVDQAELDDDPARRRW